MYLTYDIVSERDQQGEERYMVMQSSQDLRSLAHDGITAMQTYTLTHTIMHKNHCGSACSSTMTINDINQERPPWSQAER